MSLAYGGDLYEDVTIISPNCPLLYNPGRLVSSKGSSRVLVSMKGCLK